MKKHFKKLILILPIALIIFGLSGCGNSGQNKKPNSSELNQSQKAPAVQKSQGKNAVGEQMPEEVDTSDWKTYRNEKCGFEIQYPEKINVSGADIKTMVYDKTESDPPHIFIGNDYETNGVSIFFKQLNLTDKKPFKDEFEILSQISPEEKIIKDEMVSLGKDKIEARNIIVSAEIGYDISYYLFETNGYAFLIKSNNLNDEDYYKRIIDTFKSLEG